MTPLQLEILMHYRCSGRDYRDGDFSAPAVRQEIDDFLHVTNMLSYDESDKPARNYRLTDRADFFLDHILALPLPVSNWRMP